MKKVCLFILLPVFIAACSPKPEPEIAILPAPGLAETQEAPTEPPASAACVADMILKRSFSLHPMVRNYWVIFTRPAPKKRRLWF